MPNPGLFESEERAAWNEYLEALRAAGDRYEAVEAWAWDRLKSRLRDALKRAAARAA